MADDPRWPRAGAWLAEATERWHAQPGPHPRRPDLVLVGVPAHRTSLSPTGAHETPGAIRAALQHYSTWVIDPGLDLAELRVLDLGDLEEPDGPQGEEATIRAIRAHPDAPVLALGGDNSVTYAVAHGARADGLVTLDAHHDLRDGTSNGSPVRRLVEAGIAGQRIVQVGIADFANAPEYAARARDLGITVVPRGVLGHRPIEDVLAEALEIASGGSPDARVHVDLDVDVCDRAVAPACPASLPGGISAVQLRAAARLAGADPRVVSLDLTEVDATTDAPDQRTVRLAALCVLEVATGVLLRGRG
jgi:formiminoglutamase